MPISWNEILRNAIKFSGEWKGAKSESAEKQTFWNEFFQVFGIKRRVVASFENPPNAFRELPSPLWSSVLGGDYGRLRFLFETDSVNEGHSCQEPPEVSAFMGSGCKQIHR